MSAELLILSQLMPMSKLLPGRLSADAARCSAAAGALKLLVPNSLPRDAIDATDGALGLVSPSMGLAAEVAPMLASPSMGLAAEMAP